MRRSLILDPKTGKPISEAQRILHSHFEDYVAVPEHVQASLDRATEPEPVMGSSVGWRDVLTPRRILTSDGVQVLNTASETILCPDYSFAADSLEVGDTFKYTLLGDLSGQAAANTVTFRLRWGGVGGTSIAASGAFAWDPTTASTTVTWGLEFWVVCRSTGSSGSLFCIGRMTPSDFDDASATTLQGNLNMLMIPASAPAATTVNTTTANALSPTVQFSSATATVQWTNHIAILESLN